jgi:sugar lactone lactonase YvrE
MNSHTLRLLTGLALTTIAFGKTIPNYAEADLVLGKPDFVTATSPLRNSFSLSDPMAIAIDPVSGKVFVSDRGDDRILRYANASALTNGAGAEAVFGQTSFSTSTSGTSDLLLNDPSSIFLDRRGRLWVADQGNSRVLVYEAASYRNSQAADRVYGQPNFTTSSSATTASKMSSPYGVCVDSNDNLWVGDLGNDRVLKFSAISTKASGSAADSVLGQATFLTSAAAAGASGMKNPVGVTVSSAGTLYVGCSGNHRILRFNNAASLGNGAPASAALGQPDFISTTSGLSNSKLNTPYGVWITQDDALWVSDFGNNRVLRFDAASTKANGAAANGVVGQPNFDVNTPGLTSRNFGQPFVSPFVDAAGSLWISEETNDRVLRFPADVTLPLLTVTTVVPKTTKAKKLTLNGTASDAYGVALVQFKVNAGPLQTATGTTAWQIKPALKKGKNTITLFATDSVGNVSVSTVLKTKRK